MFFKSSKKPDVPKATPPMRPLTPAEVRQVVGGPMGSPTLGNKPSEPRELMPAEIRLVSGGPGGYPGLGVPPPPDQAGSQGS